MEILLEFEGSRRPLTVTASEVIVQIHDAVKQIVPGIEVEKFTLQRFSVKWNTFVDLTNPDEIVEGDRVTLSPKQSPSLMEQSFLRKSLQPEVIMSHISTDGGQSQISKLEEQVHEVRGIMVENIVKLGDRREKMEDLGEKAENLKVGADEFQKGARHVRKEHQGKHKKLWCILITIPLVIIAIIIIIIVLAFVLRTIFDI